MKVIKQGGEAEEFDSQKLEGSLLRSGATLTMAREIAAHVQKEIKDGMSTNQIYKHAAFLLKKKSKPIAVSYSLKRAVMELGPSGFPFEKFIAELLREKGFEIKNNQFAKGHCAEHELDFLAYNENKFIIGEAKFHNGLGVKSDLKTALYVKAKFDDLKETEFPYNKNRKFDEGWLITNTKFTSSALNYGLCNGMILISWEYPKDGDLQDMIEDSGLHPITCLESLNARQKIEILKTGTVLCKKLKDHSPLLQSLGLNSEKIKKINEEIALVCSL